MPTWQQKVKSSGLIFPVILLAAFGTQRAYMNLRADDPLPDGFVQYTPEAFAEAQATGAPILVDVYASWCPTCMAQHKVLATLLAEDRYRGVRGLRVDYDRDRDFVRQYEIVGQSTILVFDGPREINRSIGLTASDPIHGQLDSALATIREGQ